MRKFYFAVGSLVGVLPSAVFAQSLTCLEYSRAQARYITEQRGKLVMEVRDGRTGACRGCGCKGGPGYRSLETRRCAGYHNLISLCGPAPHTQRCLPECKPFVDGYSRPERPEQGEAEKYLSERPVKKRTRSKRTKQIESPPQPMPASI